METQTWRTDLWSWGQGRKERMECLVRVIWKYTLPYVKYVVNGNLLYDSRHSTWGSVTTLWGGRGKEVGGKFKREGT